MVAKSRLDHVTFADANPSDLWVGIPQPLTGIVDIPTPDEEPYDGHYDTIDPDDATTMWLVVGVQTDTIAQVAGAVTRATSPGEIAKAERAQAALAFETDRKVLLMRATLAAREVLAAEAAEGVQLTMPVTLTQLLREPITQAAWRVSGLWPAGGNIMLAAQAKAGKTHVLINLIRALVDGDRLFDRFPVQRLDSGKVTALDFELPREKWREWLGAQRIVRGDQVNTWALKGQASRFNILDKAMRHKWSEALKMLDTRVLAVDCLGPILGALGLDENSQRDVGTFLEALQELAFTAGIEEMVLVHHMGHGADRARGASRFADWPDATWTLSREKTAPEYKGGTPVDDPRAPRFFGAYGRDVDFEKERIDYFVDTGRIRIPGALSRPSECDRRIEKVVEFVGANPGSGLRRIGGAVDPGKETGRAVRDAIARAVAEGYLRTVGDGGGYALTTEGELYLVSLRSKYAKVLA